MGVDFSTDVLVHILVLLPSSSRRRCRLVCKHWRYAVDERTQERDVRTKILAVVKAHDCASAYVVDEARGLGGRHRRVWTGPRSVDVIGTRNGLICFLDAATGAITVSNPCTREAAVSVPPAPRAAGLSPCSPGVRAHEAYGFGFHPLTLRYTVVHVPCYFNKSGTFDAVQVYTLSPDGGGGPWREVLTSGASGRCQHGGVVCVDGSAYWITGGAEEGILSLDLEDWRVAPVKWLPETPERGCSYRLTEMRARLCVAVTVEMFPATRVEVWCLENTKEQRWARRYNIQIDTAKQQVTWPLFAHGEHAITVAQEFNGYDLRKHKMSDKRSLLCSMVRVWKKSIMRYDVLKNFGRSPLLHTRRLRNR